MTDGDSVASLVFLSMRCPPAMRSAVPRLVQVWGLFAFLALRSYAFSQSVKM